MSEDNDNKQTDEEDMLLFRRTMKHIKPLSKPQDRVLLKKKRLLPQPPKEIETQDKFPYLSDHANIATVAQEQLLFFARQGVSPKQIKKLKQGQIPWLAMLDLHGDNVKSARSKLLSFLSSAYEQDKRSLLIIHGKGHSDQPILKNKLNIWLQQLDFVLAFCSALPKQGGTGAIYVLLKAKR